MPEAEAEFQFLETVSITCLPLLDKWSRVIWVSEWPVRAVGLEWVGWGLGSVVTGVVQIEYMVGTLERKGDMTLVGASE